MRNYPKAAVKPVSSHYFGHEVIDPYRYLEDASSPETQAIVQAQRDYTHAFFAAQTSHSAAELEAQLRARPHETEYSCVREALGSICAMHKLEGGIFDIVELDEDMRVSSVILNEEMVDNRMHFLGVLPNPVKPGLYAILTIIHGHPRCCVVVWDNNQKKALAELDGTYSHTWSADGKSIYYALLQLDSANNRNINHICRYSLAENASEIVYTHLENAVGISVCNGPESSLFFSVMVNYNDKLMLWYDGKGVTPLNDGRDNYLYLGELEGRCCFKTNAAAPMNRIIAIGRDALTIPRSLLSGFEIILPETDALLRAAAIVPGGILAAHERDAASELALFAPGGEMLRQIPLPDRFGSAKLADAIELSDRGRVFFNYESFTRRLSLFSLDVHSFSLQQLMGDARDVSDIAVDQVFLPARDGQRILVYLVRLKDQQPSGDVPALMFGYGGYAATMPPWPANMVTENNIVDWVRRGRIYAHCNIRGGLEYGEEWHHAAMGANKKNAFNDYIDIAEYLVASGWTRPGLIVATGKSNGGLLATAVTTMRPDLFGVVVASVPHTDMLRFRYDDRGMMYITEYGDPESSEEMFSYMHSYSPYHNIREGETYPWVYVQTGEMDNNVPPYHGKKFALRLQAAADEKNPVLLEVLPHGSHDRGVGDEYYLNISQMQTFVELGLEANR